MTGFPTADAPSPELLQRCVHCGFCLPTCPTYAVLGVEMDSPRGRIRLMETVWQGRVDVKSDPFERHMYGCLDCRACETACPSGVEFGKLMEGARSQIEAARPRSLPERLIRRLAFRALLPRPAVLGPFAHFSVLSKRFGAAAVLHAIGSRIKIARRLAALLDLVPDRASSRALPATYPARGAPRGRVALFTGCVMRAAFSDTNAATARVLSRNGFEVVVPETQTCCGALHAHAGERADARTLARSNIASLEQLDVVAFIVNAAGCGAALKEYGWLLKDDPAWSDRGARFASRVKDASEFLADAGLTAAPGPIPARVAYDDPCHLLHGQRISRQPRALLEAIPELRVMPLIEADWCCGSAGTYNVTQPDLSAKLLERKVGHITASGAEMLVTANPGCQMQIASGLRAAGAPIAVVHLMDLLDRAYAASRDTGAG